MRSNKTRAFFIHLILLLGSKYLLAQDIHFSQFNMQPLMINPALAGDYEGSLRLSVINRRQWGQLGVPIQTTGASVESKIWLNGDFLTLGLQFINDKTTQTGYITNKGYFTAAYQKTIQRHVLHAGLQIGYADTRLNPDQTFPSQFDASTGGFDSSLGNGESNIDFGNGLLDINAGFFWSTVYNELYRFRTGLSLAHVNFPDEAQSTNVSRTGIRYLLQHSTEARLSRKWSGISLSQLMYTEGAKEFITYLKGKRHFEDHLTISAGVGYRGYVLENDAVIFVLESEYHFMKLGVSYDWNVSSLSNETQKTSVEFSLSIRTPAPKKRKPVLYKKKMPCPVFIDPR
ncbi:MAG: PorP/SprF family type IX secretion system membrane protein [Cyclobacteriaceae bacterium]